MSFRVRVFIAFALAVLPPLGLLAWGIRREVDRRITAEYEQRAEAAGARLATEIEGTSAAVRGRLAALAGDLGSDNRIRLALLGEPAARRHLLDWGGEAGRLSGLALLELQDERGRILSSAHFRNEYGLERPTLPRFLSGARGPAMVRARTPDGSLVALAGVDSVRVGATTLVIAGGLPFDEAALVRVSADPQLSVRLALPGSSVAPTADHAIVRTVTLPFLDLVATPAGLDSARLLVVQSRSTIAGLRRSLDGWVALTIAGAASVALLLAAWLAGRVSRPLRDLTRRTEAIDLDRLEQSFASSRSDEIGTLTRVLGAMTERLRASAGRLREAERRNKGSPGRVAACSGGCVPCSQGRSRTRRGKRSRRRSSRRTSAPRSRSRWSSAHGRAGTYRTPRPQSSRSSLVSSRRAMPRRGRGSPRRACRRSSSSSASMARARRRPSRSSGTVSRNAERG
jgi:HAMP domain-containing protein